MGPHRGSPLSKSVLPGERLIAHWATSTGRGNDDFSSGFPGAAALSARGGPGGRALLASSAGTAGGRRPAPRRTLAAGGADPALAPPPAPPGALFPSGTAGRRPLPPHLPRPALVAPRAASWNSLPCCRACGRASPACEPRRPGLPSARGPGQWGRGGAALSRPQARSAAALMSATSEAPQTGVTVGPRLSPSGPVPQPPRGTPGN